jgi:hypothetical protein
MSNNNQKLFEKQNWTFHNNSFLTKNNDYFWPNILFWNWIYIICSNLLQIVSNVRRCSGCFFQHISINSERKEGG